MEPAGIHMTLLSMGYCKIAFDTSMLFLLLAIHPLQASGAHHRDWRRGVSRRGWPGCKPVQAQHMHHQGGCVHVPTSYPLLQQHMPVGTTHCAPAHCALIMHMIAVAGCSSVPVNLCLLQQQQQAAVKLSMLTIASAGFTQ